MKEIRRLLQTNQLNSENRIHDETVGGWIQLSQHPSLQFGRVVPIPVRRVIIPKDIVMMIPPPVKEFKEWYYLKGQTPIGAFSYLEMIRLFQNQKIDDKVIVWRTGLPNWAPASLLKEFQSETLRQMILSGAPGLQNYIKQRRFFRFSYAAKFILHNEKNLWNGVSYELAPGGIGLLLNSEDLVIGQEVFVHNTSRGGELSINAVAVVRTKTTKALAAGQARFGLEFIDISTTSQNEIANLRPLQLTSSHTR